MRQALPVLEVLTGDLATLPDRFWPKVHIGPDCWEWTHGTNEHGYGQIDKALAHRVSYWLSTGVDPGPLHVLHRCDNPPCVRPAHLFLGTHGQNMADASTKGRMPGRPTLTQEQINDARALYGAGWTGAQIAARVGCSQQHANRLVRAVDAPWKEQPWRRHPTMKLSDDQVQEIRARYAAGGITQRALAAEYGIDQGYLSALVNRKERAAC